MAFSARKIIKTALIALIVIIVVFTIYVIYYYSSDHSDVLLSRRTPLKTAEVEHISSDSTGNIYYVQLSSETIPKLSCYLRIPAAEGPHPVMILLGGLHTGKEALHLVGETELARTFVFMTMDYPYYGEKKGITILEMIPKIPAIRRAVFNSVASISLMIDYLETRTEIDTTHIFASGVSFGSFFVIAAAATDTRIKAAASMYSGGDISLLTSENIRGGPRFLRKIGGYITEFIVLPVEPLRNVDKIAPRHFLMVSGSDDEQVPTQSIQLLYDTAQQPKELIWFETRHIKPTRGQLTQELTEVINQWILKKGLIDY